MATNVASPHDFFLFFRRILRGKTHQIFYLIFILNVLRFVDFRW